MNTPLNGKQTDSADVSTAAPDSSGALPKMQEALLDQFSELERVVLVDLPRPGQAMPTYLAAGLLKQTAQDIDGLAERLVSLGARHHVTLLPAFYRAGDWGALDSLAQQTGWLECVDRSGDLSALFDFYRTHRNHPTDLRRMLLRSIRSYGAALDLVQHNVLRPKHLALDLCCKILEEALTLLFASEGRPFTRDAAAVQFFRESFAQGEHFARDDIMVYFHLTGLAVQARHSYHLTLDDGLPVVRQSTLRRVRRLLAAFARYVRDEYSTSEERMAYKRRWRFVAAGIGLTAVLMVVAYAAYTWPERSTVDPRRISRPGGIVGTYYHGTKFQTRVLVRTDRTINLVANGPPAKGVRANHFSVRWRGFLFFPDEGKHYLCVESDDGARLFFNHRILIDDWARHPTKTECEVVRVQKGWFPIQVEFFDLGGHARIRLLRGKDRLELKLVPAKHLCCRKPDKP